jgi:hypothetical protein
MPISSADEFDPILTPRKGMPSPRLDEQEFRKRYLQQFVAAPPHFLADGHDGQMKRLIGHLLAKLQARCPFATARSQYLARLHPLSLSCGHHHR